MYHLTPMQQAFVLHYVGTLNATQAAKDAGYSADTAKSIASENLSKPAIRKAIDAHLKAKFDTIGITAERVLTELARIAFGNLRDVAEWDGDTVTLKNSDDLSEDAAAFLKNISISKSEHSGKDDDGSSSSLSFGTHDKVKALETLAKYHKLLTNKHEHTGKITFEDLLEASHEDDDD